MTVSPLCSNQYSLRYVSQKKRSVFSVPPPCFHQGSLHLADISCLFVFMLFPVSVIDSWCCVSTWELLTIYLILGWTEFLKLEICASWCWSITTLLESKRSAAESRIRRTTPPSDQEIVVSHVLWFNISKKKNENPDGERKKRGVITTEVTVLGIFNLS